MGNYLGFFSSCTFCVHVVEKPLRIYRILRIFTGAVHIGLCTFCVHVVEKSLRIYRILRIFIGAVHIGLCTFCVHRANPLTAYLPHSPDF